MTNSAYDATDTQPDYSHLIGDKITAPAAINTGGYRIGDTITGIVATIDHVHATSAVATLVSGYQVTINADLARMANATSRPASGTDQAMCVATVTSHGRSRRCARPAAKKYAGKLCGFCASMRPATCYADSAGRQRHSAACFTEQATCPLTAEQPGQQHQAADTAPRTELPVRTWDQPGDDPFAGIDEAHGYVPGDVVHDMRVEQDQATEPVCSTFSQPIAQTTPADTDPYAEGQPFHRIPRTTNLFAYLDEDDTRDVETAVTEQATAANSPILQQFQQRVAAGAWQPKSTDPDAAFEFVMGRRGRHVYGGTVTYRTKQDRRARNRRSRASRRTNRRN